MASTEEAKEWILLFAHWPEGEKEAHKRLLTRHGLPDICIPVHKGSPGSIEVEIPNLPLRTVLWKYFLLHKTSAFSNFYPPSVSDGRSRKSYYDNMRKKNPTEEQMEAIEKDLNRSAPTDRFKEYLTDSRLTDLRRVLYTYAACDPELGYCQGLNFIAFMLLIHLNEVDAFWGLYLLLNGFNIRSLFLKNSNMLKEFLNMLEYELKTRFPRLHNHMETEGIIVEMYAMEWLTTFFVYNFPLDTTRKVWDIMLARGFEGGCGSLAWIYQICMAIFQICHDQLLEWDIDQIMTSIRSLTNEIHPDILLQKAVDFYPTDTLQKKLQTLANVAAPYPSCSIS